MKPRTFILAAAAAVCSGPLLAGSGTWTSEGPYGGIVYRLYVSPAAPGTLYAGTRGGIFRSNDGGVSWVRKEAGLSGSLGVAGISLAIDAEAANTLWLVDGVGRVNRSSDGGDNWALTGYSRPAYDVNQIVDAPGGTGRLYLVTETSGVLVSNDSGASFTASGSGLPAGVPLAHLAIDAANPLRMLAGTRGYDATDPLHTESIYLSTDGGASWTGTLGSASYYMGVTDISFGAGGKVYAAVDDALYRSDDGGASWSGPLLGPPYNNSIMAVRADPATPNTVFIGGYKGLARSTDGGVSSTPLTTGLIVTAGMPASVNRIVMHPNYPAAAQLWLGTEEAGIYFSASAGASWTARSDGLAATNIRALAMFHDAATHRMFAGYGDAFRPSPALFRGNNAGPGTPFSSWAPSNTNLGAYQIRSITIDPTTRSGGIGSTRLYATGRAGPYPDLDARDGGIYRSLDGGGTWTTIDVGLPVSGNPPAANVGTVRNLVLDPRSCAAPPPSGPCASGPLQTLYATSNGKHDGATGTDSFRVLKSGNGGDSWLSSDTGIPQPIDAATPQRQSVLVVPIVINPLNPQELYVGTSANYDATALAAPTIQSGVFRSTDGGANWVFRSNGLPRRAGSSHTALDVLSLAINPANPLELWCSVVDLSVGGAASGGIYHTVDGGANWSSASNGISATDIRALLVDPSQPNVLYASGAGSDANPGSVYKSSNGGATWHSISIGLPADAATALQVDPVDPSVLYAGSTSGVWSITQLPDSDADGVPDAVEQAAPNGGDGNADGIADALQPGVGSLTSASADGNAQPATLQPYFTVSITPLAGQCSQAMDVQSVYAAYHGRDVSSYGDDYVYPRQLARFEIQDCQSAKVKLKFHGASFGSGFGMRYFGPAIPGDPATLGWHDFSVRANRIAADTWELTLDNGQFGSYRPASANAILFEGGPARSEGIFRDGFD